jgi:selenophosphate synthetase-related protein
LEKIVKAGKGVAQLGEQELQSLPPLVIDNEYGSNIDLPQIPQDRDVDLVELCNFYATTRGVDITDMLFKLRR